MPYHWHILQLVGYESTPGPSQAASDVEAIKARPHVQDAYPVVGPWDLVAFLGADDFDALQTTAREIASRPGVARSRTYVTEHDHVHDGHAHG